MTDATSTASSTESRPDQARTRKSALVLALIALLISSGLTGGGLLVSRHLDGQAAKKLAESRAKVPAIQKEIDAARKDAQKALAEWRLEMRKSGIANPQSEYAELIGAPAASAPQNRWYERKPAWIGRGYAN